MAASHFILHLRNIQALTPHHRNVSLHICHYKLICLAMTLILKHFNNSHLRNEHL